MLHSGVSVFSTLLAAVFIVLSPVIGSADDASDAQALVDNAKSSFEKFLQDPDAAWVPNNLDNAKGILIIPKVVRGGFIFGGSGGRGVLIANPEGDQWTGPAFYNLGSASFGLQAGVDVSEVVLMIMTEKGLDAILSSEVKLGADISVSAGPVGQGAGVATSDVLAYSRSKGAYAGVNLSGSLVKPAENYNQAYYGADVRPVGILMQNKVSNPNASDLIDTIQQAAQ